MIGTHHGAFTYTVGQRKGIGIGQPTIDGRPRYVLSIEPLSNTVVVGAREALAVSGIVGERPRYPGVRPIGERRGLAQVRAHGTPQPCTFECTESTITANLDEPLLGLAKGQALVVYEGDQVVGSATISQTMR